MLLWLVISAPVVLGLAGLTAFYLWTKYAPRDIRFWFIITLLVGNAVLNVLWSFLFFHEQMFLTAMIDAGVLLIITSLAIFLIWPNDRRAAWLLGPYVIWLALVTYLSYTVWTLN